jgi:hypothetical protein
VRRESYGHVSIESYNALRMTCVSLA